MNTISHSFIFSGSYFLQIYAVHIPHPESVESKRPATISLNENPTDQMIIPATLYYPAILLITENYNNGWLALPLTPSDQKSYMFVPAFQVIPLKKGRHHILLEYSPLHFMIGKWVTICSLLIYLLFSIWYFRKHFTKNE